MAKRLIEYMAEFDYQEIMRIASVSNCQVAFLSPTTIQLAVSALRYASWPARWRNLIDLDSQPVTFDKALELYETAERELLMTCDIANLELQLTRIADALAGEGEIGSVSASSQRIAIAAESLDEKTSSRITYDEFIDDLEDAFGVTHFLVVLTKGFFGLLPTVALKLDFTRVVMAIWEYFTWKAPILALFGQLVASNWLQAITGTTSTALAKVRHFASLFIGPNLANLILGEEDPWTWLSNNLIALGIKDADGGTGGEDPDSNPDLHLDLRLDITGRIANEIEIACSCMAMTEDAGYVDRPTQGTEYDGGGVAPDYPSPINQTLDYGASVVSQDLCNYATWLVGLYAQGLRELAKDKEWKTDVVRNGGTLFDTIAVTILGLFKFAALPFSGLLALTARFWNYVASVGDGWAETLTGVADLIDTNSPDLVCGLISQTSASGARGYLNGAIFNLGADKLSVALISQAIPNHVFNGLFFEHPEVDLTGIIGDCVGCFPSVLCEGEAQDDDRFANPSDYSLSDTGVSVIASVTGNSGYGRRFAFTFGIVEGDRCGRILESVSLTENSGGYIVIMDTNDDVFSFPGIGTNISTGNLAALNTWLETNEFIMSGSNGSYWSNDGTFTFDFDLT